MTKSQVDSNNVSGGIPEPLFPFPPSFPAGTRLTEWREGHVVRVNGFLGKRRDVSSTLTFCALDTDREMDVQIVAIDGKGGLPGGEARRQLREIPPFSPVTVTGVLEQRRSQGSAPQNKNGLEFRAENTLWDLKLTSIRGLNQFSKDIIVSKDAVFPPTQRHLQLRFDSLLRNRLKLRAKANIFARKWLADDDFFEYETPVLFKSTPEGAREFLVPTRQPGLAYALPQSPQQYKQVLMASGIRRYYQFARCFRDEDSRADRQPEFTQLDLEMAFANSGDVMDVVERMVCALFKSFRHHGIAREVDGVAYTSAEDLFKQHGGQKETLWPVEEERNKVFTRIAYDDAMSLYGSDKPDLRIPSQIHRVDELLSQDLKNMITHLENPVFEAIQFKLTGSPSENLAFIHEFMENLPKTTLKLNSASTPGVFVFDETKPLNGLAAFGHEAGEQIAALQEDWWPQLQHGDLLIVHARQNVPFQGEAWTELGRLRKEIYNAAVQKGLMNRDLSFKFCWVVDFPLFTPDIEPGEGQGGAAGLKATHHPFTAPKKALSQDDLVAINEGRPQEIKGAHYDLVLNGVEVGGGSHRIHTRPLQEFIMREILKMPESSIKEFEHLFEALDAGCPPHAGFAFGWDRLMTILCSVDSVRDVLAFPKNQKGEDLFVKSPSKMTASQMGIYHLSPKN